MLGPLEVRSNGQSLPLGGPKQRAVLALLLLGANRVVSRERLIADLWPDAPGRDSEHALTLQISRLRRALSAAGDRDERVVTRAPGYVLRVERDELDLDRYERLVAAGQTALAAGDAESAVARLRDAESVWRGRPLADLEFEPFAGWTSSGSRSCGWPLSKSGSRPSSPPAVTTSWSRSSRRSLPSIRCVSACGRS